MVDVHTPRQRRRNMAAIKSKHTKPELLVRSLVHSLGYRYVLHDSRLPGKPDLVFPSRRKAVFVNGCFWHMHRCKNGRVKPATNSEFWETKRRSNVERDRRNRRALRDMGWEYHVIWECCTNDSEMLAVRLVNFLES